MGDTLFETHYPPAIYLGTNTVQYLRVGDTIVWPRTPTPTITPTIPITTASISSTPSRTPTITPSTSFSQTPTQTPTRTPSTSFSQTPTITPSTSFSQTPTITPSTSFSQTPTRTPSTSFSQTPSRTPGASQSQTPTITPSTSFSQTQTPSHTKAAGYYEYQIYSTPYGSWSLACNETTTDGYAYMNTATPALGIIVYNESSLSTTWAGGTNYWYYVTDGSTYWGILISASGVIGGIAECGSGGPTPTITPTISFSQTTTQTPTRTPSTSFSQTPTRTPSTSFSQTPTRTPSTSFSQTPTQTPTTSFSQTPTRTPSTSFSPTISVTRQTEWYYNIDTYWCDGSTCGAFFETKRLGITFPLTINQWYSFDASGFVGQVISEQGSTVYYNDPDNGPYSTCDLACAALPPTPSQSPTRTPSTSFSQTPTQTPSVSFSRTPTQTPTRTPSITVSQSLSYNISIYSCSGSVCGSLVGTYDQTFTVPLTVGSWYAFDDSTVFLVNNSATSGGGYSFVAGPFATCDVACAYTPSPSITPSRSFSQTPSRTPSRSFSQTPSRTPSVSFSMSRSLSPSRTPSISFSRSRSATPSKTPTKAAASPSITPSRSVGAPYYYTTTRYACSGEACGGSGSVGVYVTSGTLTIGNYYSAMDQTYVYYVTGTGGAGTDDVTGFTQVANCNAGCMFA